MLVRIAISAGEEKDPKGRRFRYIPLSTGAVHALERQAERTIFTGRDDYVFCSRMGDRLDDSALRKRYKAACAAADLRPIKLHGLRHAAGSLLARHGTSVEVRDLRMSASPNAAMMRPGEVPLPRLCGRPGSWSRQV